MRSFGISVGIAGLGRLFQLLLPANELVGDLFAGFAALVLVVNAGVVLREGVSDFLCRLTGAEEAPYAAWSACTLCLLSALPAAEGLPILWCSAIALGASFAAVGVRDLWRTRRSLDPAHLSWFAWLIVAANTVPTAMAARWPHLGPRLGCGGYVLGLLLLTAAWERVMRLRTFDGARSPWFALGAASALACWAAANFDGPTQTIGIIVPVALAITWLVPIVRLLRLHPGTRAAWPNLFPLSNLALAAWTFHWTVFAWALAAWGVVIAVLEVRRHFSEALRSMRRRSGLEPGSAGTRGLV